MILPETLIVGPYTYRILTRERLLNMDGTKAVWGEISTQRQEILLDSGMTDERARAVLLHELLHAIDDAWGEIGIDEETVRRIALALAELFTRNDMRFLLP